MLRMVMVRQMQSIRRIESIAMVVGEAAVAWLHLKRVATHEISAYLRWTMILMTTPDSSVDDDDCSG